MLKKNIAKAMAAATVFTAAAPMANVVFADVIDSNQEQEIKTLKELVYEKFNTKYTKNEALLRDDSRADQAVYAISFKVNNGLSVPCGNYAEFEDKFDKAFNTLNSGDKITVTYDSGSKGVRVLEDGTVVDFEEEKYANVTSSAVNSVPSDFDGVASGRVIYGSLDDETPYAKIRISDDKEGNHQYITVKNGDVKLDLNLPKFKVVDGFYVDINGNSIKKFDEDTVVNDINEPTLQAKGVVEGYYAFTGDASQTPATGTEAKPVKTTNAIVKSEVAEKEELTTADLYEDSTGRLTKKGNELRKLVAELKAKEIAGTLGNLKVTISGTNKAGEVVAHDLLNANVANLSNIKVLFEQREKLTNSTWTAWSPAYEMTITQVRGLGFNETINNVLGTVDSPLTTHTVTSVEIDTIAGLDRYETAIETSKAWGNAAADGTVTPGNGSKNVVLVAGSNDKLVDGLTATPLAASLGAPVLLTKSNEIPKEVMDRINELGASHVYIVGGESAVSKEIEKTLEKTHNKTVTRLSGDSRYETSLAVANKIAELDAQEVGGDGKFDEVFVVGGKGEADALSISGIAGMKKSPILLTPAGELDKDTKYFLEKTVIDTDNTQTDIFVVGGTSSVSNTVQNKLVDLGYEVERLAGEGRQETNAKVISRFADLADNVIIAKSNNAGLVDALGAGALASKGSGAADFSHIVLATNELTESQEDALDKVNSTANGGVAIATKKQVGYGIAEAVAKFIKGL